MNTNHLQSILRKLRAIGIWSAFLILFATAIAGQSTELPDLIKQLKGDKLELEAQQKLEKLAVADDQPAIDELIKILKDSNQDKIFRERAARILQKAPKGNYRTIDALIDVLDSELQKKEGGISTFVAGGLQTVAVKPDTEERLNKRAVEVLRKALKSAEIASKSPIINALGAVAAGDDDAANDLREAFQDPKFAEYLGIIAQQIGKVSKEGDTQSIKVLSDFLIKQKYDKNKLMVYQNIIFALGVIGRNNPTVINALITVLKNADSDNNVKTTTLEMLGNLDQKNQEATDALITELKNNPNPDIRLKSANSLSKITYGDSQAISAVVEAIKVFPLETINENQKMSYIKSFVNILELMAQRIWSSNELRNKVEYSVVQELQTGYDLLREYAKKSESSTENFDNFENTKTLEEYIKQLREDFWMEPVKNFISAHRVWSAIIAFYLLLLTTLLIFYWIKPIGLFQINETLIPITDVKFQIKLFGAELTLPIRYLVLVGFFHYKPRVLDSWVKLKIPTARKRYNRKVTVEERQNYVPLNLLVKIDNKNIEINKDDFESQTLPEFDQTNKYLLLIWGEGGSGKTSLACHLGNRAMGNQNLTSLSASHVMLPVLVEQDFESSLLETIKIQLADITEEANLRDELVKELLKQRRVLVIADSFSEMNESTKANILKGLTEIPVNAAIFTSRIKENFGILTNISIQTINIDDVEELVGFIKTYIKGLVEKNKVEVDKTTVEKLFERQDFTRTLHEFSTLVGEERKVTPLLASKFAEQMVELGNSNSIEIPVNIPQLMLNYITILTEKDKDNSTPTDISKVIKASQIIAWECCKDTYRPQSAKREIVLQTLSKNLNEDGLKMLDCLEGKLRLILIDGATRAEIRFSLISLSEYLAAMWLIKENNNDEEKWNTTLEEIKEIKTQSNQDNKKNGGAISIKSFLLALRDCCMDTKSETKVPPLVNEELSAYLNDNS